MKARGIQKFQLSKSLVKWGKLGSIGKAFQKSQYSISFVNWEKLGIIHSPRPAFQNPNFESMDELEKYLS